MRQTSHQPRLRHAEWEGRAIQVKSTQQPVRDNNKLRAEWRPSDPIPLKMGNVMHPQNAYVQYGYGVVLTGDSIKNPSRSGKGYKT